MSSSSPFRASIQLASRQAFRPLAGVAALVAVACAAAWKTASELGLSTHELGSEPIVYELAFVLALFGAALGSAAQDDWRWCIGRWQPREVLLHEALAIGIPATVLALAPVAAAAALGVGTIAAWNWGFLALAVLRPLAWGLVLLRLPMRPWPRVLALLALCWWIPAALAPSFQPVSIEGAQLGAGRPEQLPITAGAWVAEIPTLLALLLAARLGLAGDRPPR